MENLIARLDLTNLAFLVLGDMNADMASTNNDNNVRQLTNIADIYGLRQLISEPTWITDAHISIGSIYTGDGSSVQTDHPSRRIIRLV